MAYHEVSQERIVLVVATALLFEKYVSDAYTRATKYWKDCERVSSGRDHLTVDGVNQQLTWLRIDPRAHYDKLQGIERHTTGWVVLSKTDRDLVKFCHERFGRGVLYTDV